MYYCSTWFSSFRPAWVRTISNFNHFVPSLSSRILILESSTRLIQHQSPCVGTEDHVSLQSLPGLNKNHWMVPMVAISTDENDENNWHHKKSRSLLTSSLLQVCYIPTDWKLATVVPIHKLGCSKDPANDRLISILAVLEKNTWSTSTTS